MATNLSQPHGKFFRETWSERSEALSFLQNYLPANILALIDVDSLEICKDSFIDEKLKAHYSGLLYRVRFGDAPGFIYFLFEHKSHPERLIHLQLLEYMVQIWRLSHKQAPGENCR